MIILKQKEYAAKDYAGLSIGQARELRIARNKIAGQLKLAGKVEESIFKHGHKLKNLVNKYDGVAPISKSEYKALAEKAIRKSKVKLADVAHGKALIARFNILNKG